MAARKKTTENGPSSPPAQKRTKKPASAPGTGRTTRKKTPALDNGSEPIPAGGGPNLVIVESPAKAKTIQKYLGSGFLVKASFGHIRDLPKKVKRGEIGIDIGAGWVPTYVNLDDDTHKRVLSELKQSVNKTGMVYLATDRDREGEAIAWHLKEALKLPAERIRRVAFNEITRTAIQAAFAQASDINMDRVRSQEARRFLDRAVGYKLSPLLRKKVRADSAGRVQSVAVRLVVEREREIQAFKPEEYWKIIAQLAPVGDRGDKPHGSLVQFKVKKKAEGDKGEDEDDATALQMKEGTFLAELAEWAGQKFAAKTEQDALQILSLLPAAAYTVANVEQKDTQEKAPPPFTTSTLQQQANIRLGFTTQRTMTSAQKLYEGLNLGAEGQVGLITYMRTDSTRIADEALKACRDHIQASYGPPYLPANPNRYASGKNAQEAHEAIRPTDVSYTPQRLDQLLPQNTERRQDLLKLYELIWRRFVACQMTPAIFAVTNVDVQANVGQDSNPDIVPRQDRNPDPRSVGIFKAKGKIQKFDGYRKVLSPKGKQEDATLPPLTEKQKLDLHDLLGSQHFTQPPPRYNEASLVKALEKAGIGRPSTYASIIKKIQDRHYVEQKERRFHATKLGMVVTDKLVQHFPDVMNLKFTGELEEKLDQIEGQHLDLKQVLDEFWGPFSRALADAQENMEGADIETGEKCPQCGRPLVIKYSYKRKGHQFIGCSGYNAKENPCKYIKPGEGEEARPEPELTEHKCPTCGKFMLKRIGPRGPFLGCEGYPECKTTMNLDAEGNPVLSAMPTQHVCDKCGKPMVLRDGKRGKFLACSGYPKCKNAKDVDAEGNPIPEVDLGIVCEKCGKPMKIRKGWRGAFLGCTGYPGCRGTKQLTPELREQLKDVLPAAAPKKETPEIEVTDPCPECEGPMKVRSSSRGYFLSCAKFPKCKGKRNASPELLEQLAAAGAT